MTNPTAVTLPLNQLVVDAMNMRQEHTNESVKDLAANINHGKLHVPILVRKVEGGKFGVIAGGRRLLALQLLAEAKDIEANHPVPVLFFVGSDEEAYEASYAENHHRKDMNEAEQILAAGKMHNGGSGLSVAEIASRYAVSEKRVRAYISLADLPADAIEAFKNNDITLTRMSLLANCANRDRVIEALSKMDEFHYCDALRDFLFSTENTPTDTIVKFVGQKAYKKAGGTTREDLFTKEDDVILEDGALLCTLADAKLQKKADKYAADGWKNVEIQAAAKGSLSSYSSNEAVMHQNPLPKKEQTEVDKIEAGGTELKQRADDLYSEGEWSEYCDLNREAEKVQEKADKIKAKFQVFTPEQRETFIVKIGMGHNAKICVVVEDLAPTTINADGSVEEKVKPIYTKTLTESLIELKTMATRTEVAQNAHIAKVVLVTSLLNSRVNIDSSGRSVGLQNASRLSLRPDAKKVETQDAFSRVQDTIFEKHSIGTKLKKHTEIYTYLLTLESDELDNLMAVLVAGQIDLNAGWNGDPKEAEETEVLCRSLDLRMTDHFVINERILKGISKPKIEKFVEEVATPEELMAVKNAKTKKLTVIAALPILKKYQWLPEILSPSCEKTDETKVAVTPEDQAIAA